MRGFYACDFQNLLKSQREKERASYIFCKLKKQKRHITQTKFWCHMERRDLLHAVEEKMRGEVSNKIKGKKTEKWTFKAG